MFNRSITRYLSCAAVFAVAPEGTMGSVRRAGINPDAVAFAAKISPETFADLELIDEAAKTLKISGIVIANDINRDFTKEDIAKWAAVDTVAVNADGSLVREGAKYRGVTGIGGNHLPPDWTSVADGKRTKWVSYIDTMVLSSAYVKAIDAKIQDIDDAKNKRVGAKKAYTSLGDAELEAASKNAKATKSRIVSSFRTGVKVIQQRAKLVECFGKEVTFSFYEDSKGNLIPSNDPIILQMTKMPKKFGSFSVTSFNNLDFDTALAERKSAAPEDTWQAILDSLSRDDGDEQPKADANTVKVTNSDQFYSAIASIVEWCNNEENVNIVYKKIDSAKSVENVENILDAIDEMAQTFHDMKSHVQKSLAKLHAIQSAREPADKERIREAVNT